MARSRLLILPPVKVTREHHQSVLAVQIEYLSTADIRSDVTALLELPHSLLDRSLGGGGGFKLQVLYVFELYRDYD